MLKVFPTIDFSKQIQSKCGEIFHQHLNIFTIFCTFCEIKFFQFEDFVLHIQNHHIDNNTKKSEIQVKEFQDLSEVVKDSFTSDNRVSDQTEGSEYESLIVLKRNFIKTRKKTQDKKLVTHKQRSDVDYEETGVTTAINFHKSRKEVEYTCLECNTKFNQKRILDQHVLDVHNGYKCPKCDKRFRRSYHINGHIKTHQAEKKFKCPIENCSRGFAEEVYLKRHLEVHTMDRTFICDYVNCDKAFHTQRRLNTHKYTHRTPRKLVCDMCGHSCRSNTELITHQRVHTGEKPFSCSICNKPFISKTALSEHMISHSDTRPHVCIICKAAFANRRVLVRHCFIHSDERTFKCKMCEKAFKHPNSLQGHIRHVHHKPKKKGIIMNICI